MRISPRLVATVLILGCSLCLASCDSRAQYGCAADATCPMVFLQGGGKGCPPKEYTFRASSLAAA